MRKLPPVGTRLLWRELAAGRRAPAGAETRFAAALQRRIPGGRAFLFGSGRAALAALLTALRRLRAGEAVILPAYTCWTVAAAIRRAGLRALPVDVRPHDFDYDPDALARLDWRGALAVVSPNLFGLPSDLPRLETLAHERGVTLIDDAAQCLGATVAGRAAGSFGAAGIVSFGRGKNITALGGGAALVRDAELAAAMDEAAGAFRGGAAPTGWDVLLKGGAMRLALAPQIFGLAEKAPGVVVGQTVYEPNFPTPAFGAARAALAEQVLARLDEINECRARRAALLDAALSSARGFSAPPARGDARPAWLRRPILVDDSPRRASLLRELQAAGIGATTMYPAPIASIPALADGLDLRAEPFPGAARIAASLIALPLVDGLTARDAEAVAAAAERILGRKTGAP